MTTLRTSFLLWRRGGRQWIVVGLTAIGIAGSVVLALLAFSVPLAMAERGDRAAWQRPEPADDSGLPIAAIQRVDDDVVRDRSLTIVSLEATSTETPPVPPGLGRFPAPGEVFVSPALADAIDDLGPAALGDRFPGTIVGEVPITVLAGPGDLVAVVGIDPGTLGEVDGSGPPIPGRAVGISGFATHGAGPDLSTYVDLSAMAAALLVVPTIVLVGAMARLTAAQREQRLAALRLAGATPGLVVRVTALETALAGLVGAGLGLAAYLALVPVAARVELAGTPFAPADLRLGGVALAATALVVPVLAAGSAVIALRRVVIGPLGVRRRVTTRRPRLVRFLVLPPAWLLLVAASATLRDGGSIAPVLLGIGAVIATLAVIGPWIAWAIGALLARLGRRPAPVIAGRRIADDPRGTYRTISGMVLAGLVAGFLFGVLPTVRDVEGVAAALGDTREVTVVVEAGPEDPTVTALAAAIERDVEGAEVTVRGETHRATAPDDTTGWSDVVVDVGTADIDVLRTTLRRHAPDAWVDEGPVLRPADRQLIDDMGRASVVLSLAALAIAVASTAIGSTASVLDQRTTLTRLRVVGTPVRLLQRARRWQAVVPFVVASAGAMASGAAAARLLMLAAGAREELLRPPDVTPMVLLGIGAAVAGCAAIAATRPVLAAATRPGGRAVRT